MNYNKVIKRQIDFIDCLLKQYDENPILYNSNFIMVENSWEHYLKMKFQKDNFITFEFIFSIHEFQINIDRVDEALDLSSSSFIQKNTLIKDFIDLLFTSRLKVEYCGSNYTKIYFYNIRGDCVKTIKNVTGMYLKFGCKTKEYLPIFNKVIK